MGQFYGGRLVPASIVDEDVTSDPNKILTVTKMRHAYKKGTDFGLDIDDTPVAGKRIVFVANNAGTIRGFKALLNVDGSSTSITFDLKKNGTTVLTGVVTITDSTGDRVAVTGTLASTTFAAGDIFSIEMAVSSSTGAQGPWAEAYFEENAAP